jgi:hypothetical protein
MSNGTIASSIGTETHVDLHQKKLSKAEWDYTEIPESQEEIQILNMIKAGFNNVNIRFNTTKSIIGVLKTSINEEIMVFLFNKYFKKRIEEICEEAEYTDFDCEKAIGKNKNLKLKKIDEMRITNNNFNPDNDKIYEYVLLDIIDNLLTYYNNKKANWYYYYYTLKLMMKNDIENMNKYVVLFVENVLDKYENDFKVRAFIRHAALFIEKNDYLFKYQDSCLYEHQKKIFTESKIVAPKLILYIAPTGTGKTLTPIGLTEPFTSSMLLGGGVGNTIVKQNRVIFVCAARHVGLALAKSAISAMKKIAFAFGCSSVSDIRLHYYSAKEATRDKNGRIRKVDNSIGDDVEIMISDIKSYIHAMLYMKAFNHVNNIIVYFDEPTISLDYDEHEFHSLIKRNWVENQIPNIVLSSATLPRESEIKDTILDFKNRFPGGYVTSIISHDCTKSIPIVNKENYVELPHFLFEKYEDVVTSAEHCMNYKTLLRYFDLGQVVKFIIYINEKEYYTNPARLAIDRYFDDITNINMTNIKLYYLALLKNIKPEMWSEIYEKMKEERKQVFESNIYFTTSDAHTLTDGPTIFLTNDVEKIAKFAIQNSKIPSQVVDDLMKDIEHNNTLSDKIDVLEKEIQDIEEEKEKTRSGAGKDDGKNKSGSGTIVDTREIREKQQMIDIIRSNVRRIALNDIFVPNKLAHLRRWTGREEYKNEFSANLDEHIVENIMLLQMETHWKILLLMGIGAITSHTNVKYNEIMKELAQNQKLYLIIASSDYIYGTNYQFCHGYISKDLNYMTQEKTIQAMGRVGRNKLQLSYTIRFRDDELIKKIFMPALNKPEVANMNKLFNSA